MAKGRDYKDFHEQFFGPAPDKKYRIAIPDKFMEKISKLYINLDTSTSYFYKRGDVVLHIKGKTSIPVSEFKVEPENIVKDIMANILYIADKKGNNITDKFIKEYKPAGIHIYKGIDAIENADKISDDELIFYKSLLKYRMDTFRSKIKDLTEEQIAKVKEYIENEIEVASTKAMKTKLTKKKEYLDRL